MARRLASARTAYLLAVVVASGWLLVTGLPLVIHNIDTSPVYDLVVDYQPARAIWEGYDIYSPEGMRRSGAAAMGEAAFGHPPSTSFWVLPVAGLDLKHANAVWAWITLFTLLIESVVLMNVLRCPAPNATAWLIFTYFLHSTATYYHVSVGQFSQPIGLLYFLTWLELRSDRVTTAGLSLGAACSMKVFPGVMLLYCLVTRRYRVVVVALATAATIALGMTAALGLQSWTEFLKRQRTVAALWMHSIQNCSIHGVVARLFHPSCEVDGTVPKVALLISGGIALLIIVAAAWWTLKLSRERSSLDVTFGLFVMVSIFTSQWAWEHYKLILVLPLALLASELVGSLRRGRPPWVACISAAAIVFALIELQISMDIKLHLQASVLAGVREDHIRLHVFEVLNWAPFAVCLIAFGALVLDRRRELGA